MVIKTRLVLNSFDVDIFSLVVYEGSNAFKTWVCLDFLSVWKCGVQNRALFSCYINKTNCSFSDGFKQMNLFIRLKLFYFIEWE